MITKHLGNVFKDGVLVRNSVSANFALTAQDDQATIQEVQCAEIAHCSYSVMQYEVGSA